MPFLPSDLANLYPWFAAEQVGGGLVDNDPVASWTDLSGLGKHATEATNRPLYKTNIQNGLPGILFDGTNDKLTTAAFAVAMSQPTTMFAVAKETAPDGTQRHITDGIGSSNRNVIFDGGSGGSGTWNYFAGSVVNGPARDGNVNIFSALFSGASSKLRKNGAQIAAGDTGAQTLTGICLGSSAGGAGGAGNFWVGYMHEIILYNADHSASFGDVEQYLSSKWAVPLVWTRPSRRRRPSGLVLR